AAILTLTRDPITSQALTVQLASSDPTAAQLPASAVIPGFRGTFSVSIAAVDDDFVDGPQAATLFATALNAGGSPAFVAEPVSFEVTDDDGPTLKLTIAPKVLREGIQHAATGTVFRNTDPIGALEVALQLDLPGEAIVPATVTIQDGEANAEFSLDTLSDGVSDGSRSVAVTASADGFASATATVTVTDENLADLVISNISAPATAASEEYVSIGYRISNQGIATANGPWVQRVFLSRDAQAGDDILVSQFSFNGNMGVGLYFEQTVPVRLPLETGNYWVVVTTDVEETVSETDEENNTIVAGAPIQVIAPYSASVQAGFDVALANTQVPLAGSARKPNNQPAPHSLVNIHIRVRGTERVISALTDANGQFSTTFQPLPGEAGSYQIGAVHPGINTAPVQDEFTLLGMRVSPSPLNVTVKEGESIVAEATIENSSDVPLHGLSISVVDAPANIEAIVSQPPATLPGSGSVKFMFTATAHDASILRGAAKLSVTSTEGAVVELTVNLVIEPLRAVLVADPSSLLSGMKRGGQASIRFKISNVGGLATGSLNLLLPNVPWLSAPDGAALPSLAPGQSHDISLLLTPAADLPLGAYKGSLAINGSGFGIQIPFEFRCLSDATGDLKIVATDEYSYYADGFPKLANAQVRIKNLITGAELSPGSTDVNGEYLVKDLVESYYEIQVSAEKHTTYKGTHLVVPGQEHTVQAFLSRQAVQYIWTVVPTEIEDRTKITIETVFETVVPMPVVTIEPSVIDLAEITADETQINIKITNHGLIAANDLAIGFGDHPNWSLTPLIEQLGTLAARSSLTIPLTIRRLQSLTPLSQSATMAATQNAEGAPCFIPANVCWTLVCLGTNTYCGTILVNNAAANCGGPAGQPGGGGSPSGGGGGGGGGGTTFITGPSFTFPNVCDCEFWEGQCISGEKEFDTESLVKRIIDSLQKKLPAGIKIEGEAEVKLEGEICACCIDGALGLKGEVKGTATAKLRVSGGIDASIPEELGEENWTGVSMSGNFFLGVEGEGELKITVRLTRRCGGGYSWCALGSASVRIFAGEHGEFTVTATDQLTGDQCTGKVDGILGAEGKVSATIVDCSNKDLKLSVCGSFGTKYEFNGELKCGEEEKPKGFHINESIILFDDCLSLANALVVAKNNLISDTHGAMVSTLSTEEVIPISDLLRPESDTLAEVTGGQTPSGGICARVKLRIDQEAVISRDAFQATLELINATPSQLQNISVEVIARDALGQDRTSFFGIRPPTLIDISGADGSGMVNPNTTGQASWIIIPTSDAAPDGPTQYFVSGTLRYTQDGLQVTVPLAAAPITVYPNANLLIDYFHQRDVFSDDPFTDEIEPSIPFTLGVMVNNTGKGEARNVRIISGQPQIIENEKGLLIDFKIIATEVAGQNLAPTLTANFGNIPPDTLKIGRWLLTSTLQGLFIDYKATFEHLDGLGNPKLSLIQDVKIHEMIHMVQAQGEFEDGLPDFLVNDLPDLDDYPDTLYLSDGTTESVSVVTDGTIGSQPSAGLLQAQISAALPPGWAYLRMAEPGDGQYRLVRVVRSDGVEIAFDKNVWTTDRTFIGLGRRPIYENILHLLDYNSTGTYTLYYEPLEAPDLDAPQSAVKALAVSSDPQIPVEWSGGDGAGRGIAFFDVFVSTDNGPFLPWVTKSTQLGALYSGEPGRHYAFYSVATDYAGNREAAPASADAQTTAAAGNTAPSLTSIANQTITEGETLSLTVTGTDADLVGNVLTYSLEPAAPIGVVLNPTTGALSWSTGESHGGTVATIAVRVTDNGNPSLSDVKSFTVTILEQNAAPTLEPILNATVAPGQLLAFNAIASDADLPAQSLTFSLDEGAPDDASIDSATGAFTWTPGAGNVGGTVIIVQVTDNGTPALRAEQSFQVRVEVPNTAPVIVGVPSLTANVGQTYSFSFTTFDAEGDAVNISAPSKPAWLSLVPTGTGSAKLEGVPSESDLGNHPVKLVVSDGKLASEQSFVIAVRPATQAPAALADEYTVSENEVLTIDAPGVLQNDTDADGDPLIAEMDEAPVHGTLDLKPDGSFTYTPEANFSGEDTFTYHASDGSLASESVTVTITITPGLQKPQITWSAPVAIVYGTPLSGQQLNATTDVPGTFAYDPPLGTILPAGSGQTLGVTFTPDDSATYTTASATVLLDVEKASLTIRAEDKNRYYLQPNPPLTASYSGFVNGENASILTSLPLLDTPATETSPVGN
ncbi:MAG: Ig-like domain-containing protein, partial [Verrucomicrobiales bacterium]|nr:Ig-like domain-containing protein [Verrucomicrobiales bacterium]